MLGDEFWVPVSVHEMHARFLQAERAKFVVGVPAWRTADLLDVPDVTDARENAERMRLLYQGRRHLLGEIPPDTKWFDVRFLRSEHVRELRAIGRSDPTYDDAGANLFAIKGEPLRESPLDWGPIVLWGHSKPGPFTILEGNHRLLAWTSSARYDFSIPVCVGLSNSFCRWHLADPDVPVLHDLWR